ncbi:MAG: ATP-binding cassette domain-containing protein, partial [Desulfovibrio sp.]|nr:ATP-binding cassette domain-containing protein [Desulfovibrio sp.]
MSFAIGQGEKVAFVGPSGCGKSTVLRLMEGFLQPQKGRMLMGGQPYEQLGAAVRQPMAFVPQQPFIFSGSLEENIFFDRQFSPQEKEKIYADAGVQSFLPKLPQGA